MQNPQPLKDHKYLNRLALAGNKGFADTDSYKIIKDFFEFGKLAEVKDMLTEACRAALSEKYSWTQGSPGNLLYFYEQLEKLVEACFILNARKSRKKNKPKKIKGPVTKKTLKNLCLPCSLSLTELNDPSLVIKIFFEFYSLKKWKQVLYLWLEAGLSNYTVLDSIAGKDTLSYYCHLQKLMDACWFISSQHKKKN